MPTLPEALTAVEARRFAKCPVKCPLLKKRIVSVGDYLALISDAIRTEDPFWFRGHDDVDYSLTPSALRYEPYGQRVKALALMADFKRIAGIKLPRPPSASEELEWALIAQHYGLPTRLLDWTESATTALYFATLKPAHDGVVFMINPIALNRLSYPTKPRVLDPQLDSPAILAYLHMGARELPNGKNPVAINPVWNSDRLILQKGVFTLHGSKFHLNSGVPSLIGFPILAEAKEKLRSELQRVGVDEMTLFPELEHSCSHLKRSAGLCKDKK